MEKESVIKSYDLARQLGIKTVAGHAVLEAALKIAKTVDKKQQDYGPHAILEFGVKGCVVRLFDKLHRLKNLLFTSDASGRQPNFESIEDTLLDGAAYNLIGYAVLTNQWPSSLEFIPTENPA